MEQLYLYEATSALYRNFKESLLREIDKYLPQTCAHLSTIIDKVISIGNNGYYSLMFTDLYVLALKHDTWSALVTSDQNYTFITITLNNNLYYIYDIDRLISIFPELAYIKKMNENNRKDIEDVIVNKFIASLSEESKLFDEYVECVYNPQRLSCVHGSGLLTEYLPLLTVINKNYGDSKQYRLVSANSSFDAVTDLKLINGYELQYFHLLKIGEEDI